MFTSDFISDKMKYCQFGSWSNSFSCLYEIALKKLFATVISLLLF